MGNELLTTLWSDCPIVICSQGDRLTGAFNFYYPLPEGPILKKITYTNDSDNECQPVCTTFLGLELQQPSLSIRLLYEVRKALTAARNLNTPFPEPCFRCQS